MLITGCEAIGVSEKALSGLVLHFGEGGAGTRPCEAAWLGCSKLDGVRPPPIMVYVSRSSLSTMRKAYKPLGNSVTVRPLLFTEKELDLEAILSMMAVGSSETAPLYMQRVMVSAKSPTLRVTRCLNLRLDCPDHSSGPWRGLYLRLFSSESRHGHGGIQSSAEMCTRTTIGASQDFCRQHACSRQGASFQVRSAHDRRPLGPFCRPWKRVLPLRDRDTHVYSSGGQHRESSRSGRGTQGTLPPFHSIMRKFCMF